MSMQRLKRIGFQTLTILETEILLFMAVLFIPITRKWLVQYAFTVAATTIVAGVAVELLLNRIKRDHAL